MDGATHRSVRRDGTAMSVSSTTRVYPVALPNADPFIATATRLALRKGSTPGISTRWTDGDRVTVAKLL